MSFKFSSCLRTVPTFKVNYGTAHTKFHMLKELYELSKIILFLDLDIGHIFVICLDPGVSRS